MPGLYQPGEYDLAGFAVGLAERSHIPNPAKMRAGDAIIGLASSGLIRTVTRSRARFYLITPNSN